MSVVWLVVIGILLLGLALAWIVIIAILRSLGSVHLQLEGLANRRTIAQHVNSSIRLPDGAYTAIDGRVYTLSAIWQQKGLIAVFAEDGCPACRDLLFELSVVTQSVGNQHVPICVLCAGSVHSVRDFAHATNIPDHIPVIAIESNELIDTFGVVATPSTVIVHRTGRVEEVMVGAMSADRFRNLIMNESASLVA